MNNKVEIDRSNEVKLLLEGVEKGCFPATLFKYREIKRAKQILTDCTFRFSSPANFNDPFDCSLDEVIEYEESEINAWLSSMLSLPLSKENPIQLQDIAKDAEVSNTDILDYIMRNDSGVRSFIADAKNKAINSRGVLALSKKVDEILLWSHYAGNQSGVAIELELKKDPAFFLRPRNITYVDSYSPTNFIADGFKAVDKILSTKSTHWAYEDELRIYKNDSADKDIAINPKAIKAVYFGVKSASEDIQSIKKLCQSSSLQHVKFFKGEKGYGQFKIEFTPI